ncbi:MAG: patatin-like phospholipase family protein [Actinomycetota bacterium]|nr:patatin-like phospholipase family protein [Actinomycetota bacterium]
MSVHASDTDRLARAGLFANLPQFDSDSLADSPWAQIATRATPSQVPAGTWLFREGDPGDTMYVVLSGRLEVVAEIPEPTVIRILGEQDVVGELALLTGAPRSASVRARRDTSLLKVTREDFERILEDEPRFAVALTKVLGAQLQASQGRAITTDPLPSTITVVPLDRDFDAQGFGERLAGALRDCQKNVDDLDEAKVEAEEWSPDDYGRVLHHSERRHDQVVLVGGTPEAEHPWTSFAIRTGDRILAITTGEAMPRGLGNHPRLRGCDLVFCTPSASRPRSSRPAHMSAWIEALEPRAVHLLGTGADEGDSIARLARRLAGRSVGVVLSGGGARGLAHIGVLEELQAAGIAIDRVAGCSMGSYVAANTAMGRSPEEIHAICRQEFVERNPMSDYTIPLAAILRSAKARELLERTFGETMIEELPREFFCVSCDLLSSELVVHRRGRLWDSVGSSMCLPAIFPPWPRDGRLLVDGGVLNNLPVDQMAETGEGPVIAVDVTARFQPPAATGRHRGRRRTVTFVQRAREILTGRDIPLPSFKDTLIRSILLGSIDTDAAAKRYADLVIIPDTGEKGLTAWKEIEYLREAGRRAAQEALAAAPSSVFV